MISLKKLFRQKRGNFGHKGRPGKVGGSGPSGHSDKPIFSEEHHRPGQEPPKDFYEGKKGGLDIRRPNGSFFTRGHDGRLLIDADSASDIAEHIVDMIGRKFAGGDPDDDELWEEKIDPWVDKYIKKNFYFYEYDRSDLNGLINDAFNR